ncbi:MAG: hypothetical protein ACOYIH_12120 [Candidatus Fimadaptatus sp.]|jgi:hypothetical protein
MQSGMSYLASVLRGRERSGGADMFCARITQNMSLDDGRGMIVPSDDYLVLEHAQYELGQGPALRPDMDVLAAWVDGQVLVLGSIGKG